MGFASPSEHKATRCRWSKLQPSSRLVGVSSRSTIFVPPVKSTQRRMTREQQKSLLPEEKCGSCNQSETDRRHIVGHLVHVSDVRANCQPIPLTPRFFHEESESNSGKRAVHAPFNGVRPIYTGPKHPILGELG